MEKEAHFCWCGLPAIVLDPRCKKHINKPKPIKKKKRGPFSGDSKWREEHGMFQAINGR